MSPAPAAGGVVAIVPVKRLDAAKSRLADLLSPAERARLVVGMLDRVLLTLRAPGCADRTLVVSADPAIRELAVASGAFVLDEPSHDPSAGEPTRHNAALERARFAARRWNPDALLVLSADLPLLEPDDLRALAALGATSAVVVAPDRHDRGTNALFLRPPDAIPFCFGPDSYRAHRRAAEARGYRVEVYRSPGTAFDLDGSEDLAELGAPP